VLVLLDVAAVASADIWSNCGSPSDHLKDLKVTITPDPPVLGQALTISASGTFDEELTAITLNYNVDGLISGSLDLCNLLSKTTHPCPIPAGPLSITKSFNLPNLPPGIPVSAQATVLDQNNQEVACIKINIDL